jgi:hypothetical protein
MQLRRMQVVMLKAGFPPDYIQSLSAPQCVGILRAMSGKTPTRGRHLIPRRRKR